MKVLIVGGGGREHALAWKLSKSPLLEKLYCAPGNAGIASLAECVDIDPRGIDSLANFAKSHGVDLTIVGPEQPLADGLTDEFAIRELRVFGPSKRAARIESSKAFAKELMAAYSIPTARFGVFTGKDKALKFCDNLGYPVVIKADGLAAGKGVSICKTADEADKALNAMMNDQAFGHAGETVVVEEFLEGPEVSLMAIVSGTDFVFLPASQDHKTVFDGDVGPNTGGMGAFSPISFLSSAQYDEITRNVFVQVIHALQKEGSPFVGCLYAGLKMTQRGPFVLEFNCRFGDPETQAVLPRLKFDLLSVLDAAVSMRLADMQEELDWDSRFSISVIMSSGGYPGNYKTGFPISGLDSDFGPDVNVFHSGTRRKREEIVTAGGRVLGVTALGSTLAEARAKAYGAVGRISFTGAHFRTDIGRRDKK